RWKIDQDRLPAGSTILFREPTLWDRYRWRIMAVIAVCMGQALLISRLLASLTKRRRAERSLVDSENRLRAILNTAIEGIITINERGVIESVNAATERIFGYRAAEMVDQNVSMLMPSPFREELGQYLANYQRTREPKIIGMGREVSG